MHALLYPVSHWLAEVQRLHVPHKDAPVSVSRVVLAPPLVAPVMADAAEVEVVGGVGWVQDAGRAGRHQ